MKSSNIEAILGFIGLIILVVLLFGFPLMWLWNWLMPELFGLKMITFWQACGLNLMSTILFGRASSSNKKD